ncbi:MAG TPA: YtxH domain-containing protein [Longimicrobiaceae bacterium]|nr:YtxH domain-containing protein [Longimicrobiaceae bacterium]
MYYDDEARRFNFLSGLLLGGVVGAGVALLLAPRRAVRRQ